MKLRVIYHTPTRDIESGCEEVTLNEGIDIIKKFKNIAKNTDNGFDYLEYISSIKLIPNRSREQAVKLFNEYIHKRIEAGDKKNIKGNPININSSEKFFQNFWILPPEVARKTIVEFNAEYTEEEKEQIEEGDFEI